MFRKQTSFLVSSFFVVSILSVIFCKTSSSDNIAVPKLKLQDTWGSYESSGPRWILSLAFSPDGKYVLTGGAAPGQQGLEGGNLKLWDAATGKEARTFSGHSRRVNSVAFSPDGSLAVSGSTDDTARLWDVATGNEIQILKDLKEIKFGIVYSVAISPDGKSVLTATTEDPELTLLDLNSGKEIGAFDLEFSPRMVAFSPDGKQALSVGSYESPELWDISSGKLVRTFKIEKNIAQQLFALKGSWTSGIFSPDGQYVLAANTDGIIRLWETATGKEVGTFKGHNDAVTFSVFSPDGKFIVSGGKDNTIRLWDKASEKEIDRADLRAENDIAYTGAFSPDGHSFVAGTERGVILHFSLAYSD